MRSIAGKTADPWPVVLACALAMAAIVYSFVLAGETSSPGAWIYAAFLVGIFAAMLASGDIPFWRRLFQSVFAVGFSITFMANLIQERGGILVTADAVAKAEIPMCHIVIPMIAIPYALTDTIAFPARLVGHYASVIGMLLLWLIATLTIGRGWCSWVCFYGGWEDAFSRMAKKPRLNFLPRNRDIREFHFAFLAFTVLASIASMSAVYCRWFCPFKLVTEFDAIVDFRSLLGGSVFIVAFAGLVVALPLLTKTRFQCSAFCPFGAFQSLLDPLSRFRVRIDAEKCVHCMQCAKVCPFHAIDAETIQENRGRPERTCAKCGECVKACPTGAISYQFSFLKPGCRPPEAQSRAERLIDAFLSPRLLFIFSAFTIGTIVSSRFLPQAIDRVLAILSGGAR